MANIINLTLHTLTVVVNGKTVLEVPASGQLARCAQTTTMNDPVVVNGVEIPTGANAFGEIEGLPEAQPDTLFFVSALVAQAAWAQGRNDVVCPLVAVRDDQGRVIGTSGLATNPAA